MCEAPKKIDEPFGSDDEDFSLMHKEWSKVDGGLKNAGVRDGLESSQDQILQDGFNSAFRDALQMAISAGKFQGSISALLSYQPPAVKSDDDGLKPLKETQLHNLLAKSTTLLSGIPHILQYPQHSTGTAGQSDTSKPPTTDLGSANSNIASASSQTVSMCLDLSDGSQDRGEEGGQTASASRSCEEVCTNKAHFWSQLESFKVQAGPLGVFTGSD